LRRQRALLCHAPPESLELHNAALYWTPTASHSCMERSLTGRICIVTGANAGLGLKCSQVRGAGAWVQVQCMHTSWWAARRPQVASIVLIHLKRQELARRGATIYMICRNEERGRAAAERVRTESGNANVHLEVRVLYSSMRCMTVRVQCAIYRMHFCTSIPSHWIS
jgi:hypothetical protein